MNRWRCLAAISLALTLAGRAANVGLAEIDGPIGPATASYVERAIEVAARRQDECLVVRLDTPGGLLDSTRDIVRAFYASPIPVVVYVSPAGASATSAGCFITLAADIAAMAPGTSIGAAHPVALGGSPGGGEDKESGGVMKQKLENYAASYIESIALKRGRNAAWAVESVRDSASVAAEKALELKVIDLLAADTPALLRQLDGRVVNGRTLHTAGVAVAAIPMTARERAFQLLWRPEVMFILMLAAIYGIVGELSNPGAIFPGVVGAIALILALYLGAILPINLAGLALILLALGLFVADVFTPTHGVLTVGGIAAFLLGAFMLFDPAQGWPRLSWSVILPAALVTAAFFASVVGAGLRAQWLPAKTGPQAMVGQSATAVTRIDTTGGTVFVEGESWSATSDTPVAAGSPVTITGLHGLTLHVPPPPPS
jgi:membrane-bound serine protease (ClpP class)